MATTALYACTVHKRRTIREGVLAGGDLLGPHMSGVPSAVGGLVGGMSAGSESTTTCQPCFESGACLSPTARCSWFSSSPESGGEEITEGAEKEKGKGGGISEVGRGGEAAELRSLANRYWPSKDGKSHAPKFLTPTPQARAEIQRVALEKNIDVSPLVGRSSGKSEPFFKLERDLFQVRDLLPLTFKEKNLKRPLFNTKDHDDLVKWLSGRAFMLQNGELGLSSGIASASVIGNKGMGKSTCLATFANLSQMLWPDVVVVYFSFDDAKEEHFEDSYFVEKLIMAALDRNGVDVQKYHGVYPVPGSDVLTRVLWGEKKKVMLIVDEIEQVFRKVSVSREEILRTIAALGGSLEGLVSVAVTGSSTHLAALVKGVAHASVDAVEKYPLAKRRIDMNGEKLRPLRLSPSLPHDVDKVQHMLMSSLEARFSPEIFAELQRGVLQKLNEMGLQLSDEGDMLLPMDESAVKGGFTERIQALFGFGAKTGIAIPDDLRGLLSPLQEESGDSRKRQEMLKGCLERGVRGLAPFITFYYGSGAREIDSFVSSLELDGLMTLAPKGETRPQSHARLFEAILRAVKKKNAKLLDEIERRGGRSLVDLIFYLSTHEWCERLQGATLEDIKEEVLKDPSLMERYVQKIAGQKDWNITLDMCLLKDDVGALYDESVIRKCDVETENEILAYPVSMLQLIRSGSSGTVSNVKELLADPWAPLRILGNSGWNGVNDGISRFTSDLVFHGLCLFFGGLILGKFVGRWRQAVLTWLQRSRPFPTTTGTSNKASTVKDSPQ